MKKRTATYQLIELKLGQDLEGYVKYYRKRQGYSWDRIARLIESDSGVYVTVPTLLNWMTR